MAVPHLRVLLLLCLLLGGLVPDLARADLVLVSPPIVKILSQDSNVNEDGEFTLRFSLQSEDPITQITVLVNGHPTISQTNLNIAAKDEVTRQIQVPVSGKAFTISLLASNESGFSIPADKVFAPPGTMPVAPAHKPPLYILAVGINHYKSPRLNLEYSANDAVDFTAAMQEQKGLLYSDIHTRVLTDENATRSRILEGLQWLQSEAREKDSVVMILLSGHGLRDKAGKHWFYLPHDWDVNNTDDRAAAVPMGRIGESLSALPGKAFLFVDAPFVLNDELYNINKNVVMFAASQPNQVAIEDANLKGGVFTYALTKGLRGEARQNGLVTIASLANYISQQVAEFSDGTQRPAIYLDTALSSTPLALALVPDTPETRGVVRETAAPIETPHRLFAVVIGVSAYHDPTFKLNYADKDAQSFADVMATQKGRFFQSVEVHTLLNEQASKDNILDSLEWLRQNAKGDDYAMVYFAGHGADGPAGSYYLLPYNYDTAHEASTALFDSELLRAVGALRARTLVFLDSCRSKNATASSTNLMTLINRMAAPDAQSGASSGVVVFSATGKESAEESSKWGGGHGAFTYALLNGLKGGAANRNNEISFKRLDVYLSEQVPLLTNNEQIPTTAVIGVRDFTFALCSSS